MNDEKPPLTVIQGGLAKPSSGKAGELQSPSPPPLADLTGSEKRLWDYICESLRSAGVEHITAGLTIKIITRTYLDWVKALKECDDKGRYAQGKKNGGQYELPHSYTEKQLKRELLKWLPEACLTIPSLATAKGKMPDGGQQDDLFEDLIQSANAQRSGYGQR